MKRFGKHLKKLFCLFLFVTVGLGFPLQTFAVQSFAAGDPYDYVVRVFPGNQGAVSGGSEYYATDPIQADSGQRIAITVTNGETLQVNGETVITLENDKYYIRGVRITGQDTVMNAPSFVVTQDQDYVVAYGMRGSAVSYTVNYVDANGNPMPGTPGTNTGYGSEGTPVIVGYYPVDGYLPYAYSADGQLVQTFNLTNSAGLSGDESQNVFTFIYLPVPAPESGSSSGGEATGTGDTGTTPGGDTGTTPGGNPGTGGDAAQGGGAPEGGTPEGGGPAGGEDTGGTEESTPGTEEILDIDVPLADGPGDETEPETPEGPDAGGSGVNPAAVIVTVIVIALLLLLILLLAFRKKRKAHETK